jgi:hypothetical protein
LGRAVERQRRTPPRRAPATLGVRPSAQATLAAFAGPPEDPDDEDPDDWDPDDWDPDDWDPDDLDPDDLDPDDLDPDDWDPDDEELVELDDDAVDEVAGVELVEESDDEVLPSLFPFVLFDAAAGMSALVSERESVW